MFTGKKTFLAKNMEWGIAIYSGNFYTCELPEGLGMRKIVAHGYLDSKECTNQGGHFLDFHRILWSYVNLKSNLQSSAHTNFINGVANPEIVYNSWKFHVLKNPRLIFFWNSLIALDLCT